MPSARWLDYLSDEDLSFVKRLVLASGSLKEVAAGYGISYPTVRLRLDRLIARIRVIDNADIHSEFERVLRAQHAVRHVSTSVHRERSPPSRPCAEFYWRPHENFR